MDRDEAVRLLAETTVIVPGSRLDQARQTVLAAAAPPENGSVLLGAWEVEALRGYLRRVAEADERRARETYGGDGYRNADDDAQGELRRMAGYLGASLDADRAAGR